MDACGAPRYRGRCATRWKARGASSVAAACALAVARVLAMAGVLAVAGVLAMAGSARAGERWYGGQAGALLPLDPVEEWGGTVGMSAAMGLDHGGRSILAVRGTLVGQFASGHWAALPTLTGDVGLRLKRLELLLSGGVELFGFARRGEWTIFAPLGFLGGAGVAVTVHPRVKIGLLGQILYLPSFTAAKMVQPEKGGSLPTMAFVSTMLRVEVLGEGPEMDD
ncbi:MAG: hypothetical protein IT371_04370 [Deltaproteobacteria bacterium]|nr:hypothetical protein [Deltaproteobacteria bacterium]